MTAIEVAVNRAPPSPGTAKFRILHGLPNGALEAQWRRCLANSDFPTHYTAPEFFLEPMFNKRGFAVLGIDGEKVTGVLTGCRDGYRVQSGLSVRPQIALSRTAPREPTMANLIAGLLTEAGDSKLVDLFLWSDLAPLVGSRFCEKKCDGVILLDLSCGPDALFRKFSENKRRNIKRAIKFGVSVAPATTRDEVASYYTICVDWSRRKGLPVAPEEKFQQTFALTRNRLLLLARHQNKVIAGIVIRFFPGGVMEYAANSSLQCALRFRPNDLLHWRAIEWGCRQGMTAYSLGGTHLFLRKFGGEVVPTTRHRLDQSILRRFAIGDWLAERAGRARPWLPSATIAFARTAYRGLIRRTPG